MIHVRQLTRDDLDAAAAIEAAAGHTAWTRTQLLECLDHRLQGGWALEDAGVLQGHLMWQRVADEAELLIITIHPGAQGRGLGRVLMERFLQDCRDHGVAQVFLEVEASNAPALALYRRTGWEQVGRRRDYYGPGKDALLWARRLD